MQGTARFSFEGLPKAPDSSGPKPDDASGGPSLPALRVFTRKKKRSNEAVLVEQKPPTVEPLHSRKGGPSLLALRVYTRKKKRSKEAVLVEQKQPTIEPLLSQKGGPSLLALRVYTRKKKRSKEEILVEQKQPQVKSLLSRKATVCQQCGDRGFHEALTYCDVCKKYAIHRYCLDSLPTNFDEDVIWYCEDCQSTIEESCTPPREAQKKKKMLKATNR